MGNPNISEQNNKIISIIIQPSKAMKLNKSITKTAAQDLRRILDIDVLQALSRKLNEELARQTISSQKIQNQSLDVNTPSTVDTSLKRRGSAISKSIRPLSRSKNKTKTAIINKISLSNQITVTPCHELNTTENQSDLRQQNNSKIVNPNRKVITDRAVYYGNVQLPYLHSSDAISSLYERSKVNGNANQQPLINPPPSISSHLLTNVKNLYIYYTGLDSLRQLGTGWSNLKSLTIMCCGSLVDLSGLSIFPSLQYIFVPHNNIRQISDLMYHSTLRCIDLQDNCIDLIDQIQYIYTVVNLQWVDISQNPISLIKQKYRIICQNLANKLQVEDNNKVHEYLLQQMELDSEFYSYENIQMSNNLIKQINQQIIKQQIQVGKFWRNAHEKTKNGNLQQPEQTDVQIIAAFQNDNQQQYNFEDNNQSLTKNDEGLQLRVTPLVDYAEPNFNINPLKKYFYNKICPQNKSQKQESKKPVQNKPKSDMQKQTKDSTVKKLAATQNFPAASTSCEQKNRLNSVSLKKRLGKLSLSKASTFTGINLNILSNLKAKQQFNDGSITAPSGLKFLSKRKLFHKGSQQLSRS